MTIFVDTSAIYAILSADDPHHGEAAAIWQNLLLNREDLLCTNYIVIETYAIVQNRLGMAAVRALHENAMPLLRVEWISPTQHETAVKIMLASGRRHLSLVDCTSFETMRQLSIHTAFAFDSHFVEQGFECVPPPSVPE